MKCLKNWDRMQKMQRPFFEIFLQMTKTKPLKLQQQLLWSTQKKF